MSDSIDFDGVTELGPHRVTKKPTKTEGDGLFTEPGDVIRLECVYCKKEIQGTESGVKNLMWQDCIDSATVETQSGVVEVPKKFLPDDGSAIIPPTCRECGEHAEYGRAENGYWYCISCSGGYE